MLKKNKICIVCGGIQKHVFEYKNFHYYKCGNCGLVSTYPLPTKSMIKQHYADKFKTGNYKVLREYSKYYLEIYKQLANILGERLALNNKIFRGLKILDIGCFTGEFLEVLAEKGADVYGVELQSDAVAIARKKLPNRIFEVDLNSEEPPKDKFDVITLLGLIEHVHNPVELLKKTAKSLKKGGMIMIQTPDSSSFLAKTMKKYWPPYAPVEHIHLFSRKALEKLLTDLGFSDIKFKSHVKKLPIGYVYSMLQSFGPEFRAIIKPFYSILPEKLTYISLPFYAGEMAVTAKKK